MTERDHGRGDVIAASDATDDGDASRPVGPSESSFSRSGGDADRRIPERRQTTHTATRSLRMCWRRRGGHGPMLNYSLSSSGSSDISPLR